MPIKWVKCLKYLFFRIFRIFSTFSSFPFYMVFWVFKWRLSLTSLLLVLLHDRFFLVLKSRLLGWILHFQSCRNFEIITVLSWTCENRFPNLKFAKMPISRVLNTEFRYFYQLFHRKSKTSSSEMQAKIQSS